MTIVVFIFPSARTWTRYYFFFNKGGADLVHVVQPRAESFAVAAMGEPCCHLEEDRQINGDADQRGKQPV